MIKGINQQGRYITVTGGMPNQPYISPGAQSAGMIRYNTNMHCVEVYDGNGWQMIGNNYASVGLSPEAENILDWAAEQRNRYQTIERLAKDNVTVADALQAVHDAEEKLHAVYILTKDAK